MEREESGMKSLKKVVEGIKVKASAHEGAKSTAQRTVVQSVKRNWDSSCQKKSKKDQMEGQ